MSFITFTYNDRTYSNWTAEQAIAFGIPANIIEAALGEKQEQENKILLRNKIKSQAGDIQSLMGTATDIGHFALDALAKIIQGINTATTLDDLKLAVSDFTEIADDFLQEIDSEAVKLPFHVKGIDAVIEEIK